MNTRPDLNSDPALGNLLRSAHPAPSLPPRFQEGVWRRLERSESPQPAPGWFEPLLRLLVRPAYAGTGLALVLFAGVWLGSHAADGRSLRAEQARYLAAVSPLHQAP